MQSLIVSRLLIVSVIFALALVVVGAVPSGVGTSQAARISLPAEAAPSPALRDPAPAIGLRDFSPVEADIAAVPQAPVEQRIMPMRSPFLEPDPFVLAEKPAAPLRRAAAKPAYAKAKPALTAAKLRAAKSTVSAAWNPLKLKNVKRYSPFDKKRKSLFSSRGKQTNYFREWWQ